MILIRPAKREKNSIKYETSNMKRHKRTFSEYQKSLSQLKRHTTLAEHQNFIP